MHICIFISLCCAHRSWLARRRSSSRACWAVSKCDALTAILNLRKDTSSDSRCSTGKVNMDVHMHGYIRMVRTSMCKCVYACSAHQGRPLLNQQGQQAAACPQARTCVFGSSLRVHTFFPCLFLCLCAFKYVWKLRICECMYLQEYHFQTYDIQQRVSADRAMMPSQIQL